MAEIQELISHAATVLGVKDMKKAIDFYKDQLGFELTFFWGEPIDYAVVKANETVSIHLTKTDESPTVEHSPTKVYIFVHDIDKLYKIYQDRQLPISHPIANRDYGMRDFDIIDLDGHRIAFGQGIEQAK